MREHFTETTARGLWVYPLITRDLQCVGEPERICSGTPAVVIREFRRNGTGQRCCMRGLLLLRTPRGHRYAWVDPDALAAPELVKIGDRVLWRGCFGMDAPQVVTVSGLTITNGPREKYGEEVESAPWDFVADNRVLFRLTNGHWAYSEQIEQPR